MKSILVATFSALAVLFVLLRPAEPSPAAVWFGPDPAFREKFKKLMEGKGNKPEEEKLVKADSSNAAAWIARFSEILAERPDDPEVGPLQTELSAAWKAAMKSEFPEREKSFFAQLDAKNKKDRVDLKKRLETAQSTFDSNSDKKDAFVFSQLVDELEVVGGALDQVGDHYLSSEAWLLYSACCDEPLRGATADLKRALKGVDQALEQRALVDLADAKKDAAEKRKAALTSKGADKAGGGGPSAPAQGSEPTDAGATVTVPLTFDPLPSVDAIQRPSYTADENYILWRAIELKGKGSSGTFENTPGAPLAFRVGSADIRFDTDGDGKGDGPADEKVPLSGNLSPVKIMLGKGENARPWAFFVTPAGQQENYQELTLNMSPDDERYRLFTCGAATVTGTLEGQPIRIIDDSMEGQYGNEPQSYNFTGVVKGQFQADLDSIVIGTGKRARPWSEYQQVGDKWFKFEMGSDGKEIKASPVKTDTGTLKLDYKGALQPTYVIVRGTATLKNAFFDVVEGGAKGIQVPVGRYELCYGEIQKGKKKQMQKCAIMPGPHNALAYDVTKDKVTVVALGAPYSLDFEFKAEEGKVTVTGESVVIIGSQGERYERPWHCVPHPDATWRKKGTKAAAKPTEMKKLVDQKTFEKLGYGAAWFPLDLVMETKGAGEVEVQLSEKKNELFGKLESAWK